MLKQSLAIGDLSGLIIFDALYNKCSLNLVLALLFVCPM